jgi:hypothetical protein
MFEQHNAPKVMSPWEIRGHITFLAGEAEPHAALEQVMKRLDKFADAWASLWAQFGDSEQGRAAYIELARRSRLDIHALGADQVRLKNELDLAFVLDQLVFIMAVAAPAAPPLRAAGGQRLAS